MVQTFRNYIDGEWVVSSSGRTFDRMNPANFEEKISAYQLSDPVDVRSALESAQKAQPAWASMPGPQRGTILAKAAELLDKQLDQVAAEMTREEGKTLPEAKGEVSRAVNIFRYFG